MQEYRWFIRNRATLAIGADRGRFQTDSDAIEHAELLLNQHPEAFVLEVWRGSKLISRIVSDRGDAGPGRF
jgi:hypothetical protein